MRRITTKRCADDPVYDVMALMGVLSVLECAHVRARRRRGPLAHERSAAADVRGGHAAMSEDVTVLSALILLTLWLIGLEAR